MTTDETRLRQELLSLEDYVSRLSNQLNAVQGRVDTLRERLLDVDGAHDSRPVAVR